MAFHGLSLPWLCRFRVVDLLLDSHQVAEVDDLPLSGGIELGLDVGVVWRFASVTPLRRSKSRIRSQCGSFGMFISTSFG